MRKYLVLFVLPFFLYACADDLWIDDVRVEKTESREFSARRVGMFEITNKNGAIESSVWDEDSIYVEFEKWATGDSSFDARDNLNDIRIRTMEESGVLSIDVDYPTRIGTSYGCNVYINLPASLDLNLETSNGAVSVSETQGDIECHTSNGAITLKNTEGDARLRTSNGTIVTRNHYGELNGRTSNGEINADVVLPRRGECVLKTSNGGIVLSIPPDTSAMIKASTSNGRIEIGDLDVNITEMEKTELRGIMGNGEGDIELETSNGGISLRRSF
jgi:hypothetical protein